MPWRTLKDSIRTDRKVNELSDFEYRLWSYLITYVDDYGLGSANAAIVKGFVFPLRKSVTEKSIEDALSKLATIGLIRLYEVDGESYLCFPKWSVHQRIQTKKPKHPVPPWLTVDDGESPPRTRTRTITRTITSKEDNMSALYGRIIAYLNEKADKQFRTGKEATRLIDARINAGASEDDFYKVIDNMVSNWKDDPKMDQYLRPVTLFGTKFDSYLNTKPKQQNEDKLPVYDTSKNKTLSDDEMEHLLGLVRKG